ncbi:MAG: hypothetical protein PHY64_00370 [Eubacteriales bacterium]|nr:hypothetical protein [Eubacteriales bacterium]
MKIKAVANLVKERKTLTLMDEPGRQHIVVGNAMYPLDGFPVLTEETIFAVLDIPTGERSDYSVLRAPASETYASCLSDNEDDDQEAQLLDMVISVSEETLHPLYTPNGMACIREAERKPIADSAKTAQYFARMIGQKLVIVVKNGFQRIATISPCTGWAQDNATEWLRDLAAYAGTLNNIIHQDDNDQ